MAVPHHGSLRNCFISRTTTWFFPNDGSSTVLAPDLVSGKFLRKTKCFVMYRTSGIKTSKNFRLPVMAAISEVWEWFVPPVHNSHESAYCVLILSNLFLYPALPTIGLGLAPVKGVTFLWFQLQPNWSGPPPKCPQEKKTPYTCEEYLLQVIDSLQHPASMLQKLFFWCWTMTLVEGGSLHCCRENSVPCNTRHIAAYSSSPTSTQLHITLF